MNGKRNGKGKYYDGKDIIYEGEYLNGKIWKGKGIETDSLEEVIVKGDYLGSS